jgi:endoglucanase
MRSVLIALFLMSNLILFAQVDIFTFNKNLGRGVNMGNMFESPKEGEWGTVFKDDYFKKIKDLGFNHVRIPIRWETPERTSTVAPYTVNSNFINRVKYIVDLATKEGLTAIINFHHHDDLVANPTGINKDRFIAQWTQVSDFFKGYDNKLLFEVLNEPNAGITPQIWNTLFEEALKVIRVKNPNRPVLMGTALYGGLAGLGPLKVPADGKVIVSIHYYDPFNFTHQNAEWVNGSAAWVGTTWNDTEIERQVIANDIDGLIQYGKNNNVPVHVGEFGAYNKADIKSRERWTTFIARYMESKNIPWAYWEWSAGFGIWDPNANTIIGPIANALTKNILGPATATVLTTVYNADLLNNQGEWILNASGGSSAVKTGQNGEMSISITKLGAASWNVQLAKNIVKLELGKTYRLSFIAKSNNNNVFTYYAGKNSDPWNSYSGYPTASTNAEYKEFSTVFKMTNPTDLQARIAMDLGGSTGIIQFKSIKLEEVNLVFTNTKESRGAIDFDIFPNPANDVLNIKGLAAKDDLLLIDMKGRILKSTTIEESTIAINTSELANGSYIIQVQRENGFASKSFIKGQ